MSSPKSKLRLIGAFAALVTLALAISCRGFFVNPTITSLSIGPVSPTIFVGNINNTVQMFAVGTFNDGSTSNNTPVSWSVSGTDLSGKAIATISASGLITAATSGSGGTGTITATSNVLPSIIGTQPITVSVACTSAPVVTPTSGTLTSQNPSITFTATCNGGQDVSTTATWFSSNTNFATFSANVLTATGTAGSDGSFFITATVNGFISNQIQLSTSGF